MINRTNNPLERFNKKLKAEIPTRPTMQVSSTRRYVIKRSYVLVLSYQSANQAPAGFHYKLQGNTVPDV